MQIEKWIKKLEKKKNKWIKSKIILNNTKYVPG